MRINLKKFMYGTQLLTLLSLTACGGGGSTATPATSATTASYTVGGTLSGLLAGNSIVVSNNGGPGQTLTANGTFTFPGTQVDGTPYSIGFTVPTNQPCTSTYGTGTVHGGNVNVNIVCGPGTPTTLWTTTGFLASSRNLHTATPLPDGTVLVAGGVSSGGFVNTQAAELYSQTTASWTAAGSISMIRTGHTTTLLPNGNVLVTGGKSGGLIQSSTELYNATNRTWTAAASMAAIRVNHTATVLPNGRVLVVGGEQSIGGAAPVPSAELYDPATNTWSAAASPTYTRNQHTATLLPNGKVLIAGGNCLAPLSAELYDPVSNSWSAAGNLKAGRAMHTATLLPNGKVLVAAGISGTTSLNTAEIYDPVTNAWTYTANNLTTARDGHTATLLPTGKVMVVMGQTDPQVATLVATALRSTELYDPMTNTWSLGVPLPNTPPPAFGAPPPFPGRTLHAATLLPNGKLMIIGGSDTGLALTYPDVDVYW